MTIALPFTGTATAVDPRRYQELALACAERAARRIWVSMFIFDLRPSRDVEGLVMHLARTLAERRALGVDVRVLLASTTRTADIEVANLAAAMFLQGRGVPQRRFIRERSGEGGPRAERLGSHAKFAIFDDTAILGSQNWTDDAFRLNVEDAVFLATGAADLLAAEFLRLWQYGRGLPRHAA